jgi:glycosyltransferase involved in cell wall biosynthesis
MKLSIITINYNNCDGLVKTMESVICQSYIDFEYIIVDGNSRDGSREYIIENDWNSKRKCEVNINNFIFKWISEPDNGIYNAMNKGIKIAGGEYCLFLNSGDYLYSNDVLLEFFSLGYTEDVISGEVKTYSNFNNTSEIYSNFSTTKNTFNNFLNASLNHQATFIKRELFLIYGYYDENFQMVSDHAFFLKSIALGNASFRFIKKKISFYNSDGMSHTKKIESEKERAEILKQLVPHAILTDYKEGHIEKGIIVNTFPVSRFIFRVLLFFTAKYIKFKHQILLGLDRLRHIG